MRSDKLAVEAKTRMRPEEPVSRIMTETVVVIEADRPVTEALDCFAQYPIHHLPVVRNGRLAGMLSSADVMKFEYFAPRKQAERSTLLNDRFQVAQIMHATRSLQPGANLIDAAELLIENAVHALPIVDEDEHVIGIVTTTDIMRCLLRGPPRRGVMTSPPARAHGPAEHADDAMHCHLKPSDAEYATALQAAETLHVEAHDPRFIGKTLLYLDQRAKCLERVLLSADRFLHAGQDEQSHALLLKSILAAKRAAERASGVMPAPFPLE